MKKVLLSALFALCLAVSAYAQPRAIGGRLGTGIEVSYQHSMGEKNMVEVELGMPWYLGVQASATYDWIFNIKSWNGAGKWNWYAGVGAGIGGYWNHGYGVGYVGVAGRIGVEYNFWFPLQLSLDWRPLIGPGFNNEVVGFNDIGLYSGIALGVRYLF